MINVDTILPSLLALRRSVMAMSETVPVSHLFLYKIRNFLLIKCMPTSCTPILFYGDMCRDDVVAPHRFISFHFISFHFIPFKLNPNNFCRKIP